jgi:hypothetical protein
VAQTKRPLSPAVILLTAGLLTALCGTALAASEITVITSVSVKGNFQQHTELASDQNGAIFGASENTMAVSGTTVYEKSTTIDTGPQNVAGDNVKTDRIIEFNATPGTGGRMVSEESVLVGSITATSSSTASPLCPMDVAGVVPGSASNSIVRAGSTLDVTEVSAHTTSDARAVSETPGTPASLDYSIDAQGLNQTPGDLSSGAVGSATAYIDANLQTGDANATAPTSVTEYHDVTSVDGLFELSKSISYTAGPAR